MGQARAFKLTNTGHSLPGSMNIQPGRESFLEQARHFTVVPVWAEVLADLETPVSAYLKLVGDGSGFLLESVEGGEQWARYSFVGRRPSVALKSHDGKVDWEGTPPISELSGNPLEVLARLLDYCQAPQVENLPPLHGGVVGYLGYDVVRYIESLPRTTRDDLSLPEVLLYLATDLVVFDHLDQKIQFVQNVLIADNPETQYEEAVAKIEEAIAQLSRPLGYSPSRVELHNPQIRFDSNISAEEFSSAVERAKEYILDGEIFQVVLSQRFSVPLEVDPFNIYRALRLLNPSPYMYYIKHPEVTLVGCSPEPMVQLREGRVFERPIAGTRRRGSDLGEDQMLEAELLADPKEIAEHVMLVDLARNDIGRVVEFGTASVDELMTVEKYSHVMHIVSSVSGRLVPGYDALDVLKATFPAGTVSGAPKVRAMEIIDELEVARRGPYAGVVGYFDFSGNMDTAITIRTVVVKGSVAYIQAGAGIVADSDPVQEQKECENKARALLAAVEAANYIDAVRVRS